MQIWLKRAYEKAGPRDGCRILVDRIWPRGVRRDEAKIDLWLKEIAPTDELRRWFNHDSEKWAEFKRRYSAELNERPEAVEELRRHAEKGRVTLVFGARDEERNNAAALKEYLERSA